MNSFESVINLISDVYISVYGMEKWNGLTAQEKHDAIMFIANDLHNALTNFEYSGD